MSKTRIIFGKKPKIGGDSKRSNRELLSKKHILYLDDEPDEVRSVVNVLQAGIPSSQIKGFGDPYDLLKYVTASENPPDIVISDYQLHAEDGIEVLLEVYAKNPSVFLVIYSGATLPNADTILLSIHRIPRIHKVRHGALVQSLAEVFKEFLENRHSKNVTYKLNSKFGASDPDLEKLSSLSMNSLRKSAPKLFQSIDDMITSGVDFKFTLPDGNRIVPKKFLSLLEQKNTSALKFLSNYLNERTT